MNDNVRHMLEQGHDHFEGAGILFRQGYPTDVVGLLLHQSLEAYFKGLLRQLKIDPQEDDDVITLFNSIVKRDDEFKKFTALCKRVNGYYTVGKLPSDTLSKKAQEEIKASLAETEKLIAKIKEKIS